MLRLGMLMEEGCSAEALQAQPQRSPRGEEAQTGAGSTIRDLGVRLPTLQPPSLATQTKPHAWICPICEPTLVISSACSPGCAGQDALTPEQGTMPQTVEPGATWKVHSPRSELCWGQHQQDSCAEVPTQWHLGTP